MACCLFCSSVPPCFDNAHVYPPSPCALVPQTSLAHAASEERTRERMHALQRKLVRAVTEAEALRHVVDRLQAQVFALRRQMQVCTGRPGM